MAAKGALAADVLVRKGAEGVWIAADCVPELAVFLAPVRPEWMRPRQDNAPPVLSPSSGEPVRRTYRGINRGRAASIAVIVVLLAGAGMWVRHELSRRSDLLAQKEAQIAASAARLNETNRKLEIEALLRAEEKWRAEEKERLELLALEQRRIEQAEALKKLEAERLAAAKNLQELEAKRIKLAEEALDKEDRNAALAEQANELERNRQAKEAADRKQSRVIEITSQKRAELVSELEGCRTRITEIDKAGLALEQEQARLQASANALMVTVNRVAAEIRATEVRCALVLGAIQRRQVVLAGGQAIQDGLAVPYSTAGVLQLQNELSTLRAQLIPLQAEARRAEAEYVELGTRAGSTMGEIEKLKAEKSRCEARVMELEASLKELPAKP